MTNNSKSFVYFRHDDGWDDVATLTQLNRAFRTRGEVPYGYCFGNQAQTCEETDIAMFRGRDMKYVPTAFPLCSDTTDNVSTSMLVDLRRHDFIQPFDSWGTHMPPVQLGRRITLHLHHKYSWMAVCLHVGSKGVSSMFYIECTSPCPSDSVDVDSIHEAHTLFVRQAVAMEVCMKANREAIVRGLNRRWSRSVDYATLRQFVHNYHFHAQKFNLQRRVELSSQHPRPTGKEQSQYHPPAASNPMAPHQIQRPYIPGFHLVEPLESITTGVNTSQASRDQIGRPINYTDSAPFNQTVNGTMVAGGQRIRNVSRMPALHPIHAMQQQPSHPGLTSEVYGIPVPDQIPEQHVFGPIAPAIRYQAVLQARQLPHFPDFLLTRALYLELRLPISHISTIVGAQILQDLPGISLIRAACSGLQPIHQLLTMQKHCLVCFPVCKPLPSRTSAMPLPRTKLHTPLPQPLGHSMLWLRITRASKLSVSISTTLKSVLTTPKSFTTDRNSAPTMNNRARVTDKSASTRDKSAPAMIGPTQTRFRLHSTTMRLLTRL